ncbi:MAG: MFS transporter [Lachnospiraceae bacterium]|jgi:UMF1 family MFS transporter
MGKMTKLEKQWILYDVGNSAFTMLCTTIIPIYFKNLATSAGMSLADSTAYLSYALSISTVIVALLGPTLGTLADTNGYKKPLFGTFFMIGVVGCLGLSVPKGWLAFLLVLILAKAGYNMSLIFYDSMLSDVTTDERMDVVSSHGYAWGYIGSCIPFVAGLILILFADKIGISAVTATMGAIAITAIWWFFVTLPLIKNYQQIHGIEKKDSAWKESMQRLWAMLKRLPQNKPIFYFLIAFFFYIDGVYTIIDLATSYGKDVGITDTHLLLALLLTQIVAFPCSILFARFSKKFKSENLIQICIIGYIGIVVFALQLDKAWEFWFLAVCVAVFQGAIQALSRSYFAKIIPKEKSSEYFGFYDIFGKGAAFFGTTLMGISTQISGSSKTGVALLGVMFIFGFIMFRKAGKCK